MKSIKTFDDFHILNEQEYMIKAEKTKSIVIKSNDEFYTISQKSAIGSKTNVIVIPNENIEELIEALNKK